MNYLLVNVILIVFRSAVKGSVVLLPLLGITWLFGFFALSQGTIIFAWLFTILNSLQVCSLSMYLNTSYDIWIGSKHISAICLFSRKCGFRYKLSRLILLYHGSFKLSNQIAHFAVYIFHNTSWEVNKWTVESFMHFL